MCIVVYPVVARIWVYGVNFLIQKFVHVYMHLPLMSPVTITLPITLYYYMYTVCSSLGTSEELGGGGDQKGLRKSHGLYSNDEESVSSYGNGGGHQ